MFNVADALRLVMSQRILCVGDLMLDEFVYGDVLRVSPEAPTPILAIKREEKVIGGAGNVARNIVSLGARCVFIGVVGQDDAGGMVGRALDEFKPAIEPHLVVDRSRPTTRKARFVSEHYSAHLLRADWEVATPVSREIEDQVIAHATEALPRVGAVVLSDYAKGVLTPRVIRAVIDEARKLGKPVSYLNDANAAALWGHYAIFGSNSRETSISSVIGTGNGGGVILEGNVVKGKNGFGGELGHVLIPYQSIAGTGGIKPECNCGRTGDL